jgi:hypothetical protein
MERTMNGDGRECVQIEIGRITYEVLREIVDESEKSLEEALEEAITEWIQKQREIDPDDPAFTVLEELDAPDAEETNASELPDIVEEWDGRKSQIDLADM